MESWTDYFFDCREGSYNQNVKGLDGQLSQHESEMMLIGIVVNGKLKAQLAGRCGPWRALVSTASFIRAVGRSRARTEENTRYLLRLAGKNFLRRILQVT